MVGLRSEKYFEQAEIAELMGTVETQICGENVAIRRAPRSCRSMGPITDPVRNVTKDYERTTG
jgi:hypothetical protein